MKKRLIIAGALLLASANAGAQDGTVSFSGRLLATTCAVAANGSADGDVTVRLRTVPSDDLATAGARTGRLGWRIQVGSAAEPCLAPRVQLGFRNGGNVNAAGRLDNTGTATNVDIVLVNMNDGGVDIDLSTNDNSQVRTIPPLTGFVLMNYAAEYYATGQATGGTVVTSVQYDLIYP